MKGNADSGDTKNKPQEIVPCLLEHWNRLFDSAIHGYVRGYPRAHTLLPTWYYIFPSREIGRLLLFSIQKTKTHARSQHNKHQK